MGRAKQYVLRAKPQAPPVGLQVGLGALVVLVATITGALVPGSALWGRELPMVMAVFAFAALPVSARAVASTAALGYLLLIGFLVNRFAELSWHGWSDVGRLLLLGGSAGAGLIVGARHRMHRRTVVADGAGRPGRLRPGRLYIRMREDIRGG